MATDPSANQGASQALHELDRTWYTNQRPRLLDVIGEYAGQELFIIDGDSLIQTVLKNDKLRLAKEGDPSYQLLHAKWILESFLANLLKRDCSFEIVFFEVNKPFSTTPSYPSPYLTSSLLLTRQLLISHLLSPSLSHRIPTHTFTSFSDPNWISFNTSKRPMFLLANDGGVLKESDKGQVAKRILLQRLFLFEAIVRQGLPVVLLSTATFRDGKMISYVYDTKHRLTTSKLSSNITNFELSHSSSTSSPSVTSSTSPSTTPEEAISQIISLASLDSFESPFTPLLSHLYYIHTQILPTLNIKDRAQLIPAYNLDKDEGKLLKQVIEGFLTKVYSAFMTTGYANDPTLQLDLDGRIFFLLLSTLLTSPHPPSNLSDLLPSFPNSPIPQKELEESLQAFLNAFPSSSLLPLPSNPIEPTLSPSFLPFSHPTFNKHFNTSTSVNLPISDQETGSTIKNNLPLRLTTGGGGGGETVFNDESIWEPPKAVLPTHLGGPPPIALDARQKKKKDRRDQRYMAAMQKSAASLTGALGTSLKQQVIPAVGKRSVGKSKMVKSGNGVGGAGPGVGVGVGGATGGGIGGGKVKEGKKRELNSKEKLLAANATKKQSDEKESNTTWWLEQLTKLSPLPLPGQIASLTPLLRNKRASDRWLGVEIILKRLDLELRLWIAHEKKEDREIGDKFRVFLTRTVMDLMRKWEEGEVDLNEKQGKTLMTILETLGLRKLVKADVMFGKAAALGVVVDEKKDKKSSASGGKKGKDEKGKEKEKDKKGKGGGDSKKEEKEEKVKLSFSFVSLTKSGKALYEFMAINEDPLEFQLRCMGEWMVRSLDSKPDPRVNFAPDKWQRDVLDKIDADESMLIVAPTSSGKTFISFAAMEKVLRESDDGVVVYVAPTKALVNQVAAEVFARFSKDVPGAHLWAISTLDYRINNPAACQILVTVPHVLSTMLLSPALAKVWAPRLRRIILDEVHSISSEEGGAIWEQILLMNPQAPIIGLSATVGAPERFSSWLESVEANTGRKYSLIEHKHRFNALRKFAYAPRLPHKKIGTLTDYKSDPSAFPHVHPISALAFGDAELPEDLALEPRDALSLWKAMSEVDGDLDPKLNPSTYFAATPYIGVRHVIGYEAELKAKLVSWMKAPGGMQEGSPYLKVVQGLERPLREATAGPLAQISKGGRDAFYDLFLPLLADLNTQGLLPAILFNFDRKACENICHKILDHLEEAESKWRTSSPEWKRRLAKAKEAEKLAKAQAKAQESAARNKKDEDEGRGGEDDGQNSFDPDDPSEEFSFVGKGLSQVEFKREVDSLAWIGLDPWLISALRRGVGVHHSGMNRQYRVLVENLFRRGVLRVVISTGTLALGINAPARTCVFAGDSVFLNALQFRQCAGRAGRRGFDNLGNVVFVGISLDRIQRLLLSRLPKLGGTFSLSTTLILRLHNLLHGTEEAPLPSQTIESLLTLPRLSVADDTPREQILSFVRFNIEYLRRSGLLNESGQPSGIYGIVQGLYASEPGNLALIALFRSGELHRLARTFDDEPDATLRSLLIVLAHLFGRVLRRAQSKESLVMVTRNSSSLVILPSLPPRIQSVLDEHQEAVVTTFATYATEFSRQHSKGLAVDERLPVSDLDFSPSPSTSASSSSFISDLQQTSLPHDSLSPFVALSGHTDTYSSIRDLSETTRKGLGFMGQAVPDLETAMERRGEYQLDAYALDFWRHGSLEVLIRDNGIRRGDVWYVLGYFDTALSIIKTSLESLYQQSSEEREEDNDSDAGADLGDDDGKKTEDFIARPSGVNDDDWRLYLAIATLAVNFRAKYQKIYA